jgi:hypothetical protein
MSRKAKHTTESPWQVVQHLWYVRFYRGAQLRALADAIEATRAGGYRNSWQHDVTTLRYVADQLRQQALDYLAPDYDPPLHVLRNGAALLAAVEAIVQDRGIGISDLKAERRAQLKQPPQIIDRAFWKRWEASVKRQLRDSNKKRRK